MLLIYVLITATDPAAMLQLLLATMVTTVRTVAVVTATVV